LKSRTFGLGQTNWADKVWGIWGIFGQTISTYFGKMMPYPCSHFYFDIKSVAKIGIKVKVTTWIGHKSLVHVFHYSTIISTKNIHLGLGFEFEFGLQRIRDLAFVFP
jgi:hypothetical protein